MIFKLSENCGELLFMTKIKKKLSCVGELADVKGLTAVFSGSNVEDHFGASCAVIPLVRWMPKIPPLTQKLSQSASLSSFLSSYFSLWEYRLGLMPVPIITRNQLTGLLAQNWWNQIKLGSFKQMLIIIFVFIINMIYNYWL